MEYYAYNRITKMIDFVDKETNNLFISRTYQRIQWFQRITSRAVTFYHANV